MFKNLWLWFLRNVLKIQTETTKKELDDNTKYAKEYQKIDEINYNSIFSNKLATYSVLDSTMQIDGENARTELLNKTGQSMWKKMKKITSMTLGYGGIVLVPYVKQGKIYYDIVSQDRLTINKVDGDLITSATILAEIKTLTNDNSSDKYLRWVNYTIENGDLRIEHYYTNDKEQEISCPDFWKDIKPLGFTNVDRCLFGYIKSPINNRNSNDKYGVPITYGCEKTILEIKECLKQIQREFELKEAFVGADITMFNGENGLPTNGLYRKINSGDDNFWEVFDPAFRDSSYYARLEELYTRLEKEIGTSKGILSQVATQNATATEIKRSMYDTFAIVDDIRSAIEKGLDDFFYACNVLANAYNLSPIGEYKVSYSWDYSLIEDTESEYKQMVEGLGQGIVKKVELRNWIKPDETIEESQQVIDEINAEQPDIKSLLGE